MPYHPIVKRRSDAILTRDFSSLSALLCVFQSRLDYCASASEGRMRKTILAVAVVIFGCSLALSQAQEKILYSFSGPDGWKPVSKLLLDSSGNLYGTTTWG